jgi:hypothetical protein
VLGNACLRKLGVLGAATHEGCDETAFAWAEGSSDKACHVQASLDLGRPSKPEALELASLKLLGYGIPREERDPQPLASCTLDRLA